MPILPPEPDLYPDDLLDEPPVGLPDGLPVEERLPAGEETARRTELSDEAVRPTETVRKEIAGEAFAGTDNQPGGNGAAGQPGGGWFALHTLPRREKDLMRRLRSAGIAHYGPLVPRRFRSPQGRKRTSYVPLFPGYVFARLPEAEKPAVYETGAVCQCLPVADAEQLLADLRQIRRLISCDAPLTPEARLLPGQRVRVRSGALLGLEGTVITRRGRNRLVVAVRFLQNGASVLLDDCELEPLA